MPKILILKEKKEFIPDLEKSLIVVKQRQYFVGDVNQDFHTTYGVIKKEDLKKKDGSVIKSSQEKEFVLFSASFTDNLKKIKRLPQTMPLKDIGLIIAETGINKESVVVEAGIGSGALAACLANICKHVYSYELKQEHLETAKQNMKMLGLKNIEIKNKDIYKCIDEKDVDVIILDLAEPWQVIVHAKSSLKIGGFFVAYSPSATQLQNFVNEINKHENFIIVKSVELLERSWKVEGRIVRPKIISIAHSGFITIARRIC